MLKNGATPDVVDFTRATLDEITGTVIPAIADASEADQRLLDEIYAMFEAALAELEAGNAEIFNLNLENRQHSSQHKICRDEEAVRCEEKRECDYDLWDLWKVFVDEERELRSIEHEVDGHFCADKNGTLFTFRAQSVVHFEEFFIQKPRVELAEQGYDLKNPICQNHFEILDEKTEDCDGNQLTLEQSSCQIAGRVQLVQNEFDCAWKTALDLYDQTVREVRILQEDRINEFTTLEVVQCLLNRTTERNGRPCEESTDEITVEITHCEHHRTTVNSSWLELIYHIVPPCPAVCVDRDSVQGRCYPEMPPYPCQVEYLNAEYASLPEVPMPVFSEVNSHCNFRPDCQECHLPEIAMCSHDLACPPGGPTILPPVTAAPPTLPPVTQPPPTDSCGVPPVHPNADVPAVAVPYGGYAIYTCHEGYSVNGNGQLEQIAPCCPVGHVFGEVFPCQQTMCGSPPQVWNARYVPSSNEVVILHGSSAPYECLEGYELSDGSTTLNLLCNDGLFEMHGGCQPVGCGAPPTFPNALSAAATDTVSFPSSVEYDCLPGYSLGGNAMPPRSFEITCQADGTYSSGACLQDTCSGPPPSLTNSEWTEESQALLDAGDPLTFTVLQHRCLEGFSFPGIKNQLNVMRNVQCRPSGIWSAVWSCLPINDCNGHSCGAFGVCRDLHMNYTCDCLSGYGTVEVVDSDNSTELICGQIDDCHGNQCGEGGTCEDEVGDYTCNCRDGFMLMEYGTHKTCDRVQCGEPPSIENAQISTSRDNGGKAIFEDVTMYECVEGHSLTGTHDGMRDFELTCLSSGEFSAQPSCQPIDCGQPEPVPHSTVASESVLFPNAAEYQCSEGYTVTGFASGATSFQRYCTDSGQLLTMSLGQAVLMSCIPVSCGNPPTFDLAVNGNPEVRRLGEMASYTCVEGHSTDVQNPAANLFTSECLADGTWTDAPGFCSPVTCPLDSAAALANNFDGLPTVEGQPVDIAHFTTTVVYTCKEGHTATGFAAAPREQAGSCSADGVFSVSPCQPVQCDAQDIVHGPNAIIISDEDSFVFGESAGIRCGPGWEVCDTLSPSLLTRVTSQTEFDVACLADGLFSTPIICTNIDDCIGHTCGPFGVCVDGQEDYSCSCSEGFEETLVNGEKMCGNIDDCHGVSCGGGGTCLDQVSSFECQCSAGHENEVVGDASSACTPKTCTLPVLENTETPAGLTFPFRPWPFQVKCMNGFTTDVGEDFPLFCSSDAIIVGLDGTVASIPQCVPKSCNFPPPILSAVSQPEQRNYFYTELATYGCENGDAEVVLRCGARTWELANGMGSFHTCANTCGQPQSPANGLRHGVGQVNHPMSADLGCDEGYTHLSSGAFSPESTHLFQHCRAHGEFQAWGAEVNVDEAGRIICIPVQCARPAPPANWQWASDGIFSTSSPATLVCEDGFSSNGMPHALTEQSVFCGADGIASLLPAPCEPITHSIVGQVTDAVTGLFLSGASVTLTDSSGVPRQITSDRNGFYTFDNCLRGEITIFVTLADYTDIEITMDLQYDTDHGMLDAAMNPHLTDNSWRVVLTWLLHPRDLDAHVTRHQSPGGPTKNDPGSQRSHLNWRSDYMRNSGLAYSWYVYAILDRDNTQGNGVPETVTFFNLDECVTDCHFVYRVWDYCSLDTALAEVSGAVVRLYNSAGLHSTYNINQHGVQHRGSNLDQDGYELLQRRWDVFQLDTSDQSRVVVSECAEGVCPEDNTDPIANHHYCDAYFQR